MRKTIIILLTVSLLFTFVKDVNAMIIPEIKENNEAFLIKQNTFDYLNSVGGFIDNNNSLWMFSTHEVGGTPIETGFSIDYPNYQNLTNPIKVMENVASMKRSGATTSVIKTDGTLWVWGWINEEPIRSPIEIDKNVVKLPTSNYSQCISYIKDDGSLWVLGDNRDGTIPCLSKDLIKDPIKIAGDVIDVSLGYSIFITKTDKCVYTMNSGSDDLTKFADNVKEIYVNWSGASYGQLLLLKNDGTVWSDGRTGKLELYLENIKEVRMSFGSTFMARNFDNELYYWGYQGSPTNGFFHTIESFEGANVRHDVLNRIEVISPFNIGVLDAVDFHIDDDVLFYLDQEGKLHYRGTYDSGIFNDLQHIKLSNVKMPYSNTIYGVALDGLTEEKLYKDFPETLSNSSDRLFSLIHNQINETLGERTYFDDLSSAFQYGLLEGSKIISDSLIGLLTGKGLTGYNKEKIIDELCLDLLKNTFENEELFEKINNKLINVNKITKQSFDLLIAINDEAAAKEFARNFGGTSSEWVNAIGLCRNEFSDYNSLYYAAQNTFKQLGKTLSYNEIFYAIFQESQLELTGIDILLEIIPENSVFYNGFLRLRNSLQKDLPQKIVKKISDKKTHELISNLLNDFVINKMEDSVITFFTEGKMISVLNPITNFVAKRMVDIFVALIPGESADTVIKTHITKGLSEMLVGILYEYQTKFLNYKISGNYPLLLSNEIEEYKLFYNLYLNTLRKAIDYTQTLETRSMYKELYTSYKNTLNTYTYDDYYQCCLSVLIKEPSIFNYTIIDGNVIIKGLTQGKYRANDSQTIIIPDTISGYKVTEIADNAFLGTNAEIIITSKYLEKVGQNSFSESQNIKQIVFYDKVDSVGNTAFNNTNCLIQSSSDYLNNHLTNENVIPFEKTVDSITVLEEPLLIENINIDNELDLSGVKLQVRYIDNTIAVIDKKIYGFITEVNGENKVVVFYGGKSVALNTKIILDSLIYNLNYIDENNNIIAPTVKKTAFWNDEIIEDAQNISGYTLINNVSEETLKVNNQEINFIYRKNISILTPFQFIKAGDSLILEFKDTSDSKQYNFISSNEKVAEVDVSGTITAMVSGSAEITVENGNLDKDVCMVYVMKNDEEILNVSTLIEDLKATDNTLFTKESYQNLMSLITKVGMVNLETVTVDQLKMYKVALNNANIQLVAVSNLKDILDEANKIDKDLFTSSSYKVLSEAINDAIQKLENGTKQEISACIQNIKNAINGLVFYKGEIELLKRLVEKIEKINREDYVSLTLEAVDVNLIEAKEIISDENVSKEDINEIIEKLINAFSQLKLKSNKVLLIDLINRAEKIDDNLYTTASYDIMYSILVEANSILNIEDITQEKVDEIAKMLEEALEELVPKKAIEEELTENFEINSDDQIEKTSSNTGDDVKLELFSLLTLLSGIIIIFIKLKKEKITNN